ncbi:uncharacterized protein LOC111625056 [Centruroides sculpturatus]|uniref:uncharacterized protein LOC111625056 n=1 Tax=Centruroides sculpturatus TaxID=218467 RepID=UPI000C6D27DD|nr:uncharacterized protein LOC111625056 [Centruroides sculpturatus]
MKNKEDLRIKEILEEEFLNCTMQDRDKIREDAKQNILKLQEENRKSYNKKRKPAPKYQVNDLVAIQRTQYGTGLKLRPKFFGPYKVTSTMPRDRYAVEKIGHHEGPNVTVTAADHMKPWPIDLD